MARYLCIACSDWRLPEKTELFNRSFGLLLAFISGVLMTAYSSMLKLLVEMDSMQVVVIRGVLQLLVMGTIARHKGIPLLSIKKRKVSILLFFVAFTGGLRLLFIFTSMSRLPLGDSTTILFSSPIIVMVLSIFILKVFRKRKRKRAITREIMLFKWVHDCQLVCDNTYITAAAACGLFNWTNFTTLHVDSLIVIGLCFSIYS